MATTSSFLASHRPTSTAATEATSWARFYNGAIGVFVYGGAGNDSGHGSEQGDLLYGEEGDDLIVGGEFSYASCRHRYDRSLRQ